MLSLGTDGFGNITLSLDFTPEAYERSGNYASSDEAADAAARDKKRWEQFTFLE
jgi:hypothetical protein